MSTACPVAARKGGFRGALGSLGDSESANFAITGLYIANEVVAAHGGTIDVESSAERGTTFTVRLPRLEQKKHSHRVSH